MSPPSCATAGPHPGLDQLADLRDDLGIGRSCRLDVGRHHDLRGAAGRNRGARGEMVEQNPQHLRLELAPSRPGRGHEMKSRRRTPLDIAVEKIAAASGEGFRIS
jgi:hypothetical protein